MINVAHIEHNGGNILINCHDPSESLLAQSHHIHPVLRDCLSIDCLASRVNDGEGVTHVVVSLESVEDASITKIALAVTRKRTITTKSTSCIKTIRTLIMVRVNGHSARNKYKIVIREDNHVCGMVFPVQMLACRVPHGKEVASLDIGRSGLVAAIVSGRGRVGSTPICSGQELAGVVRTSPVHIGEPKHGVRNSSCIPGVETCSVYNVVSSTLLSPAPVSKGILSICTLLRDC